MPDEADNMDGVMELSQQELDSVTGGMNLMIASSFFQQDANFAAQQSNSGSNDVSTASVSQSVHIVSSAFELIATGIPDASQLLGKLEQFEKPNPKL
ncbi:hypothetical protein SAMD00079811_79100 (plasmid) [Scytonema sp. HK-05]|uniref:CTB family bacteriocin n=1 Tax=Scytonema sp. HK-05 TaxID=1137095 RepID=UPI000937AF9A|nr:CTB family bacteriocin [Scytonema sp. HK-05]OKH57079.1 hypothetical protein NIES2130_21830 [Scytonema sp. HK-05]BAY50281.1 hypothetical protein SAMD00079811_79100 [Scytonema sp. HK-05]